MFGCGHSPSNWHLPDLNLSCPPKSNSSSLSLYIWLLFLQDASPKNSEKFRLKDALLVSPVAAVADLRFAQLTYIQELRYSRPMTLQDGYLR